MLAEFRRSLIPTAQKIVDGYFHHLNMKSRPEEIERIMQGEKMTKVMGSATVTTYAAPMPLEFFPNRTITAEPSYLNNIQGAGALTTQGIVSKHTFENGNSVYLIQYKDYKDASSPDKYHVSTIIPVGNAGEQYVAGLDLASAQAKVEELSR